ncbi:hypothetical protein PsYK624_032690 [Phanerochaete sordida]|uniref:Uncharacterized protein n=1 Tax=Phanerochaete sordida TaxID=48140 RepID=A0A9P3G2Q6_9APHY|nr:hypothetical protein PsYK624_032690 [Phanerochaete sordida]
MKGQGYLVYCVSKARAGHGSLAQCNKAALPHLPRSLQKASHYSSTQKPHYFQLCALSPPLLLPTAPPSPSTLPPPTSVLLSTLAAATNPSAATAAGAASTLPTAPSARFPEKCHIVY